MASIIESRWEKVQGLSLKAGAHAPNSTFCVMEAVAFVAGEKWSDAPQCACPVISTFLRTWNDGLPTDADRDRLLQPLIPRIVNTRNPKLEEPRAMLAADWLIRAHTPAWLRLAGLTVEADALANFPEITGVAQGPSIRGPLEAAQRNAAALAERSRDAAWAVAAPVAVTPRAAAWDAAWAGARAAAVASCRMPAAAAALRFGAAGWPAVWYAACDAAWYVGMEKFNPTMLDLQQSSLRLVERMISLE